MSLTIGEICEAMHQMLCIRANDPIAPCSGKAHLSVYRVTAKAILASNDPAAALHDHCCDAEVQAAHGLGGCPQRDAHVNAYRRHTADWFTPEPDLFGDAA